VTLYRKGRKFFGDDDEGTGTEEPEEAGAPEEAEEDGEAEERGDEEEDGLTREGSLENGPSVALQPEPRWSVVADSPSQSPGALLSTPTTLPSEVIEGGCG
jgi:hypothetical protein